MNTEIYTIFKTNEIKTEQLTITSINGWNSVHSTQMNFFLSLNNSLTVIANTAAKTSFYYLAIILFRIPFKFESIHILLNKGYYLEAIPLIRNLYEVFIKIRFFLKYPNDAADYLNKIKRVNFKNFFNEFSTTKDTFYYDHYGTLLSEFAHGGIGETLFSLDKEYEYAHNFNELNLQKISYPLNMYHYVLLGYLNLINFLEANYDLEINDKAKKDKTIFAKYMDDWLTSQLNSFPENKRYYELLKPIISF